MERAINSKLAEREKYSDEVKCIVKHIGLTPWK